MEGLGDGDALGLGLGLGSGMVTVTLAVMVASPSFTAVTVPSSTVATVSSLLVQITSPLMASLDGRVTVAFRVMVFPSVSSAVVLSSLMPGVGLEGVLEPPPPPPPPEDTAPVAVMGRPELLAGRTTPLATVICWGGPSMTTPPMLISAFFTVPLVLFTVMAALATSLSTVPVLVMAEGASATSSATLPELVTLPASPQFSFLISPALVTAIFSTFTSRVPTLASVSTVTAISVLAARASREDLPETTTSPLPSTRTFSAFKSRSRTGLVAPTATKTPVALPVRITSPSCWELALMTTKPLAFWEV